MTILAVVTEVKSRRQEYSAATREALLDSATGLFAERGYARTSLEEIAAGARVTKGALYGHFAGKQALFRAALERLEESTTHDVLRAVEAAATPWDGALAGLDAFLLACRDTTYGRVVMREGPVALPYAEWCAAEELHSYKLVVGLVRMLIDAGEIDPLPLEAAARIVHAVVGAAAMLIAGAEGADQQRAFDDARAVVLRLAEGIRRPRAV
ncbi:TetR/AcrR family transcriptional regulator [Blastococcus sp. PRF04-17]|uniref:TetR/AcrR family transcriptional regulator n=1 Tax=Blastococcus sp. PRF04-17 TaxID=2933797 RepID=UPI001FF4103E|nr:TetR family transcriptional regulator [Blastococcus sp. PRF04-17]UOY02711.1 TetR/AcrR family transcriptional regulator [Blastococcus sp. PRF04-17]